MLDDVNVGDGTWNDHVPSLILNFQVFDHRRLDRHHRHLYHVRI